MFTKGSILFFCMLMANAMFAQEEFIDAPSQPLTKVKFVQLTGGVIIIKALLDDFTDSLSFIMDTGSGGISLDSTTVASLGLQPSEPERIIRGIGGTRKVGFLKNRHLAINTLVIDSLNFHVIDYDVLTTVYGEKIDGIIGYSVFSRYIVKVDYDLQEITFCSLGNITYPKGGYLFMPRIHMLPALAAEVKDARAAHFNYLFDTGAGLTVLFSEEYAADSAFIKPQRKRYSKQGEGLGGKVSMQLSVIKELKIGPYKFKKVPINIFQDDYNVTSYPLLGGLIGNDIFRRFNCIFNYNKKQIHLTPNRHFQDPFDYAYSGIELYLIAGKIVTGNIPPGSPAEKAGFKAGDEVIAVNHTFAMNLNDLKQALQSTIGRVKVVIRRNGEMEILTLKVINILR